jgi:ribonuclease E
MSRQRLRSSLSRTIQITCPRCHGQGKVRTVHSLATSIIHILQEQAVKCSNVHFEAQVPLEVATFLTNEQRNLITQIERLHNIKITIVPNTQLQTPNHYIKQIKADLSKNSHDFPSYSLIEKPKTLSVSHTSQPKATTSEPVIKRFLSEGFDKQPPKPTSRKQSALKKFLSAVFGAGEPKETKKKDRTDTSERRESTSSPRTRRTRRHYNNNRRPQQRSRGGRSSSQSGQRRSSSNRRYHNNRTRRPQ